MFIKSIPIDATDPQNGYGQQIDICAQIVQIKKAKPGQWSLVVLRDFQGQEEVVLISGRNLPQPAEVNAVKMFKLSGDTKRGQISYRGFYNPNSAVPDQFKGKLPPGSTKTGQQTNGSGNKKSDYGYDAYKNRGVALSYAVTLLVDKVIDMGRFWNTALDLTEFINTGNAPSRHPENPYPAPTYPAPAEQEIPEVPDGTASFYGSSGYASGDSQTAPQQAASPIDDIPF